MSTTDDSPGIDDRERLVLALGAELNALIGASRALTERSAAVFHPELRPAAFHLARWLFAYGPAKPSVIADAVAMDRSSTSALLGRMKSLGLVERLPDPADGRAVRLSLTDDGTARVLAALDLRGSSFLTRLDGWRTEDIRAFTDLMHAFNASPGDAERDD
jgi:DNA-binding MarR family transcriptional regulator